MEVADALKAPAAELRRWLSTATPGELVEAAGLVRPHEGQTLRMLEAELSRRLETS